MVGINEAKDGVGNGPPAAAPTMLLCRTPCKSVDDSSSITDDLSGATWPTDVDAKEVVARLHAIFSDKSDAHTAGTAESAVSSDAVLVCSDELGLAPAQCAMALVAVDARKTVGSAAAWERGFACSAMGTLECSKISGSHELQAALELRGRTWC
jgi:hypothetical protein